MAKKRVRKRSRKSIGVALYILAMATVIIVTALCQRNPQSSNTTPKKNASEYFVFSDVGAIGEFDPGDPDHTFVKIKQLGFKIKPIGGNATEVKVIPYVGSIPQEDSWTTDSILLNQGVDVGPFIYPFPYLAVEKQDSVYPVKFYVWCHEAEGFVNINVTENNIVVLK